jgi:DNA-binding NtrC family response regulator
MENQSEFKFFIVDDDFFCSSMYEQYLRNMGCTNITHFSNGVDCLNNLHLNPDIIFLDHDMNDLTGFEVLKKIKRINPGIYVVMISGQDDIKTAVDALKYGAFDYLIKDGQVSNKIEILISKIIKIKEELKKSNAGFVSKLLSFF